MERLSHDLNLALDESAGAGASAGSGGCGGSERRKLGFRRRTRSAGNLPAACSGPLEEGSSSSPGRRVLTNLGASGPPEQPLSDSDEGKPARVPLFCPPGRSVESDSFNENLSPTRPPYARRKRKYKKMAIDYVTPIDTEAMHPLVTSTNLSPATFTHSVGLSPVSQITKKKRIIKTERATVFCGKRKWSVRERSEVGEMRERSFSGGCTSKPYFYSKNFTRCDRKFVLDKTPKSKIIAPGKIILNSGGPRSIITPSLPGSSSFNFVYKNPNLKNGTPCFRKITGFKITTELPPVFDPAVPIPEPVSNKHKKRQETGMCDDEMDCANEAVSESSLSSSGSDGVVTCDSDREGDDELTDWPGSDEITVFNRTLNLKTSKVNPPPSKPMKKDKFLPKYGPNGCKNRPDRFKTVPDDEAMMSDSTSGADKSFTSFGQVKEAGLLGNGADAAFFESFQANSGDAMFDFGDQPRTNFSLQKTSSSDLNMSEKSPQSDHCCGDSCEVREIRAGCRRVRDERPGLVIASANNELLSRFLQDSHSAELRLAGPERTERQHLRSLAQLYSLDLQLQPDVAVLRKTSNTMQATHVDGSFVPISAPFSEYKRRCYGEGAGDMSPPSPPSPPPLAAPRHGKSLFEPGDVD